MTIIAGFSASRQSSAPLHLAAQLSRCTGSKIVAASVVERPGPRRGDPVEEEYYGFVETQTRASLERVVAPLRAELDLWVVVQTAASIPEGLTELAAEVGAELVVVGSSSSGLLGRIALGIVTDRLVHTAELPVAIAPRGYPAQPGAVSRVTVGYGGRADAVGLISTGAELARRWSVRLRIASFTVQPPTMYGGAIESSAEGLVVEKWARRTREDISNQLEQLRADLSHPQAQVVIGAGAGWRDAVDDVGWEPGDVLLLGSGAAGPTAQVFLGSAAARILRHAPVPVMIMPRRDATG